MVATDVMVVLDNDSDVVDFEILRWKLRKAS